MKATASKYRAPCDYKRDAPSLRRLISTYPTNCSPINNKHNKLVSDVLLESDVLSKKKKQSKLEGIRSTGSGSGSGIRFSIKYIGLVFPWWSRG